MEVYKFLGHDVECDRQYKVTCSTCSIPKVIADAVKFMSKNQVYQLTLDDSKITYSHMRLSK